MCLHRIARRTLPILGQSSYLWLVFIICWLLFVQLAADAMSWRYERALLWQQPWRILSGHVIHLNWTHWLLNVAGLCLAHLLVSPQLPARQWPLLLLFCSGCISLMLYLLQPAIGGYLGLSGAIYGLLIVGAMMQIQQVPSRLGGILLLVAVVGKIALEQLAGGSVGGSLMPTAAVAIEVHLYGALAGVLYFFLFRWRR